MPTILLMLAGNVVLSTGLAMETGDPAHGVVTCGILLLLEGIAVGMAAYLKPSQSGTDAGFGSAR